MFIILFKSYYKINEKNKWENQISTILTSIDSPLAKSSTKSLFKSIAALSDLIIKVLEHNYIRCIGSFQFN